MDTLKKAKEKMKEQGTTFPEQNKYLQLGVKKEHGGVEPTGFHKVKLVEEPQIVKEAHYYTGVERQVVRYKLEEDGEEKLWSHVLYKEEDGKPTKDEDGKPIAHYLIENLEDITVGDWFGLQMMGNKGRNFIRVTYPLQEAGAKEEGKDDGKINEEDIDINVEDVE